MKAFLVCTDFFRVHFAIERSFNLARMCQGVCSLCYLHLLGMRFSVRLCPRSVYLTVGRTPNPALLTYLLTSFCTLYFIAGFYFFSVLGSICNGVRSFLGQFFFSALRHYLIPSRLAFSRMASSMTAVILTPNSWASRRNSRLASMLSRRLVARGFSIPHYGIFLPTSQEGVFI